MKRLVNAFKPIKKFRILIDNLRRGVVRICVYFSCSIYLSQ